MYFRTVFLLYLVCSSGVHSYFPAIPGNWDKALETTVSFAVGQIPVVGSFLSSVLSIFWPSSAEDIWEMIQQRVEEVARRVVKEELIKKEHDWLQAEIRGLKQNLETYKSYGKDNLIQKGQYLTNAVYQCKNIKSHLFTDSVEYRKHYIPLAVTFAYIHLSVLAEQYKNGPVLFKVDTVQNSAKWAEQLNYHIHRYKDHINHVFVYEWQSWRKEQLYITSKSGAQGRGAWTRVELRDRLDNDNIITSGTGHSSRTGSNVKQLFDRIHAAKENHFNKLRDEFFNVIKRYRDLDIFAPNSLGFSTIKLEK